MWRLAPSFQAWRQDRRADHCAFANVPAPVSPLFAPTPLDKCPSQATSAQMSNNLLPAQAFQPLNSSTPVRPAAQSIRHHPTDPANQATLPPQQRKGCGTRAGGPPTSPQPERRNIPSHHLRGTAGCSVPSLAPMICASMLTPVSSGIAVEPLRTKRAMKIQSRTQMRRCKAAEVTGTCCYFASPVARFAFPLTP